MKKTIDTRDRRPTGDPVPIEDRIKLEISSKEPLPSVGRIVHYVLESGPRKGDHRPAIIVRTVKPLTDGYCMLQVFTDGENDGFVCDYSGAVKDTLWRSVIAHDEKTKAPGSWHWPEREDAQ